MLVFAFLIDWSQMRGRWMDMHSVGNFRFIPSAKQTASCRLEHLLDNICSNLSLSWSGDTEAHQDIERALPLEAEGLQKG